MPKLVVGTFLTLDGVMQPPGTPDEDRDGGFEHGGWSVNYWDDIWRDVIVEDTQKAEALVLGRKTYELFAGYWPNVTREDPLAAKLNGVAKYVASLTLTDVGWSNSSLHHGDVVAEVRKLKEQDDDGEIQVPGSWELVQTLLRHDLVDEFRLWLFPVVLASGKRLFGGGTVPVGLKLVETKATTKGVFIHRYERVGPVTHGSFGIDERSESGPLKTKTHD